MKVRAKVKGFDGVALRQPGEVFEYEGPLARWMEPVEVAEVETREPQSQAKQTPKKRNA